MTYLFIYWVIYLFIRLFFISAGSILHTYQDSLSCLLHDTCLLVFPTWAAVFDGDEGCKVLGVVAEHYWVFVALGGRPM